MEILGRTEDDGLAREYRHFFYRLRIAPFALFFLSHEKSSEPADLYALALAQPLLDERQDNVDQPGRLSPQSSLKSRLNNSAVTPVVGKLDH